MPSAPRDGALKELVTELTIENHQRGWGRPRMRYSASEKLENIRPVEESRLPVKCTFKKLGLSW